MTSSIYQIIFGNNLRRLLPILAISIGTAIGSSHIDKVGLSILFNCGITSVLLEMLFKLSKILSNNYIKLHEANNKKLKKYILELQYAIVLVGFLSLLFVIACEVKAKLNFLEGLLWIMIMVLPALILGIYAKKNPKLQYNGIINMMFSVFYTYFTILAACYFQSKCISGLCILLSTAYVLMVSCIDDMDSLCNIDRDIEYGNATIPILMGQKKSALLQISKVFFAHFILLAYYMSQQIYIYAVIVLLIMIGSVVNNIRLLYSNKSEYENILSAHLLSIFAFGLVIISKYFII